MASAPPFATVHVLDLGPLHDAALFDTLYARSRRQEKIGRLMHREAKVRSLGAGLLLDCALCEHGITNPQLTYNENGKPLLQSGELFFSLSHSGDRAVCAVGNEALGVDLERLGPADLNIAQRFFAPGEYEQILASPDPNAAFFDLWCKKESFVKALGKTLNFGFRVAMADTLEHEGTQFHLHAPHMADGYMCALCCTAERFTVRHWSVGELIRS